MCATQVTDKNDHNHVIVILVIVIHGTATEIDMTEIEKDTSVETQDITTEKEDTETRVTRELTLDIMIATERERGMNGDTKGLTPGMNVARVDTIGMARDVMKAADITEENDH